ncbi:MAG: M28 family metallopeptidase [Candidatus Asgardarchaeia archaeon]
MLEDIDPMKHIYELSVTIGPRRPVSDNEWKAAGYIFNFFKKIGLEPMQQKFLSISTFSLPYLVIFGLYLLSIILYLYEPLMGLILSLIAFIIFLLEGSSKPVLIHILPKGKSHNIYVRIKPKGEVKRRLILVGHYDSSRAAWFFSPGFVKYFRALFLAIAFSAILIPIIEIFVLAYENFVSSKFLFLTIKDLGLYLLLIPTFFIVLGFFSMLHRELFYKDVPGANDNASGVGVLLSLAEIFSKIPLSNTEIWCVATGSEESGMFGMIYFLKYHEEYFDKNNTFILNFDNIGAGDVYYIVGEGLLTTLKSDKTLVEIASNVAKAHKDWNINPKVYKLLPTDATSAIARGFKALSIMSFNKQGLLPNWHWHTDTYENVDEETVKKALNFAYEIIKEIDKLD